jgi:DNA-binding CsgD family transcriptional regulator
MPLDIYNELRKIWANIPTDEKIKDSNFDIRLHKKLLDIFQVGSYYYLINNVRKPGFNLVSPEIEKVLGYPLEQIDLPFFTSLVHPDDMPFYLNFETAVEQFFSRIAGEKLFKYKVQYDHRMRRADGQYIRVLSQYVIIQHDEEDVRTFVVHTDITHLKKDTVPVLSFIGLDGEPSYNNVDVRNIFKPTKEVFTRREKDILKALASGMSSSEISEALNISKHTVDSHRKNMLKKTEAKSTNEIISIAFNRGWV